jgi:beta-glucanase (GH16 family)
MSIIIVKKIKNNRIKLFENPQPHPSLVAVFHHRSFLSLPFIPCRRLQKTALLAFFSLLVVSANARGWSLVWSDEFSLPDGSAPDASKWGYDTGGGGWGNNELQYYTSRTNNARIEGGKLVIEAKQENYRGSNYTSARVLTKGKWDWTYGRMEARIKIPRGQGIWPAFWMLGANIDSTVWPGCGEIDIMENIGAEPSIVHGTIHGPGYSGGDAVGGPVALNGGAAFADDYHVFAVEWETNRIRWFMDDHLYFTANPRNLPLGKAWVFKAPQFIILNVAVGGIWPGSPNASTVFPQKMLVDHVRVYSFTNSVARGGNALSNPGFEAGGLKSGSAYGAGFKTSSASSPVRFGANSFKVFGQFNGGDTYSAAFQDKPCSLGDVFSPSAPLHTPSGDKIDGANTAWVEVSSRNVTGNTLSIYRSAMARSSSTSNQWLNLAVTNQINTTTSAVIGSPSSCTAPADTVFAQTQVVFRQQANAGAALRTPRQPTASGRCFYRVIPPFQLKTGVCPLPGVFSVLTIRSRGRRRWRSGLWP